jgi:hypothetical protein
LVLPKSTISHNLSQFSDKITQSMAGPFKSKFIPYVDQIKAWRRAGKTWKEVTEELGKLGIKADPGNVCRVIGRIKRRPYPLGAEPEPEMPQAATPRPSDRIIKAPTATPKTPQEIQDEYVRETNARQNQPTSFPIADLE